MLPGPNVSTVKFLHISPIFSKRQMFLFPSTDVSNSLEVLPRNYFNYFGDGKPEGIQDKAFF